MERCQEHVSQRGTMGEVSGITGYRYYSVLSEQDVKILEFFHLHYIN